MTIIRVGMRAYAHACPCVVVLVFIMIGDDRGVSGHAGVYVHVCVCGVMLMFIAVADDQCCVWSFWCVCSVYVWSYLCSYWYQMTIVCGDTWTCRCMYCMCGRACVCVCNYPFL